MSSKTRWIKGAIEHPGALKEKAQKAGETTREYAQTHKHDGNRTGDQARLALTLMSANKDKNTAKEPSAKSMRSKLYGEKE